jgi:hypothetical protein
MGEARACRRRPPPSWQSRAPASDGSADQVTLAERPLRFPGSGSIAITRGWLGVVGGVRVVPGKSCNQLAVD